MDHDETSGSNQGVRKTDANVLANEIPRVDPVRSAIRDDARTVCRTLAGIARDRHAAALADLRVSQAELSSHLSKLLSEMESISSAVEGLTLDPATYSHMEAARESLRRSRSKLITVRGRLGRLRGFEESDRLFNVSSLEASAGTGTSIKKTPFVAPGEPTDFSATESYIPPDSSRSSELTPSENGHQCQILGLPP
jgi:hypothetical protein